MGNGKCHTAWKGQAAVFQHCVWDGLAEFGLKIRVLWEVPGRTKGIPVILRHKGLEQSLSQRCRYRIRGVSHMRLLFLPLHGLLHDTGTMRFLPVVYPFDELQIGHVILLTELANRLMAVQILGIKQHTLRVGQSFVHDLN